MIIEKRKAIDLDKLGEKIKLWFIENKWELKCDKGPSSYAIMAKKAGKIRVAFAACRALIVVCCCEDGVTKVKVKQGSWTENLWSNAAWFAATGGMNLLFTFWSFEVQREFQNYVKEVLDTF